MTEPAQANATLTRVSRPPAEKFDGPADGPEKWTGTARVYFSERRTRRSTPAGEDRIVVPELIVATGDPAVEWKSGDVVEFTFAGAERKGTVETVETRELDGIPRELVTSRIVLEAA
jgi:hypothetical protein